MSKVVQSSGKAGAAKKTKIDTDNLDIGSETPIERMDIVLPGQEEIGAGLEYANQQPLDNSVNEPASPSSNLNGPTVQNTDVNNEDAYSGSSPSPENNANTSGNGQVQNAPSFDSVEISAGQSGADAPLAPELNSLNEGSNPSTVDNQQVSTSPSAGSTSSGSTGQSDGRETNVAPTDIVYSDSQVAENASGGTVIATLSTIDADEGDTHTYAIVADPSGYFEIVGDEIRVKDGADLDFETSPTHEISIQVTDSAGNIFTETMTIDLTDINEHDVSSISDTDTSANTIAEDAANGDSVGITASATDGDGSNNTVTYSLSDDAGGIFTIDASTGEVSILDASGIDYESATSHTIEVTATSDDGSTSTESYTVNVSDISDETPTDMTVSGNEDLVVTSVAAVQGEAVVTGEIVHDGDAFGGTNGGASVDHWQINHNGGDLVIDALADGYNGDDLDVKIMLYLDDGAGNFTLVASNDDGASGADGSTSSYDSYISETNLASGTYMVAVGNYHMDGTAATDTSMSHPGDDYSGSYNHGPYQLTISGDNTVEYFDHPSVTGTWGDPNGNAVVVSDTESTAASETIAAGSVIGSIDSVVDLDAGDTFTFALTDDASGKFEIDADTGEIKLAAEHDASTAYSDTVDVQVTDAGGNTYVETVGIQLGTENSETLTGTSNSDIMHGFGGQDTLNGGAGDDVLVAGDVASEGGEISGSNLITNGGFENTSEGWTLNSGPGFQFYTDGDRSVSTTEGSYYLDMDEAPGNIDIEQALSGLTTGTSYQLSFDTAATGGYDASVEVYWNGELVDTITSDSTTMSSNTFTVIGGAGDGSDTIQFVEVGAVDYGGTALDNVQLFEMTKAGADTLNGGDGDDTLISGTGSDTLNGGDGTDTLSYQGSDSAVNVNLATGATSGGDAEGDTISSIENVIGSDHNDTITGDAANNAISGGGGNDTMYGGDEGDIFVFGEGDGADTVHGGSGGGWTDTIELSDAGGDLGSYGTDWTVSLTSGSIDAQDANSLTLSDDADGTVTLADGSTVDFYEIERIEFWKGELETSSS